MRHPIDRGTRRQQFLDRRTRGGGKRRKSDEVPFLHRFAQLSRPTRERIAQLVDVR